MKKEHLKLVYVFLFSLLSLSSCENSLLNETTEKSVNQISSDLIGQQKAITALNQFRSVINQTSTRSLSEIKIESIKSETYVVQFSLGEVNARSNISKSDTIDIYTITFEKEGKKGYSILSPDERVGRMYAYTEDGTINDTITNKGLAIHLNGIRDICKTDLAMYYTQGGKSKVTRNTRAWISPNFLEFEWGQREPYNALCPKLCGEKPALAGGLAVAAAEVIMYYKKPLYDDPEGGIYDYNNPDIQDAKQSISTRGVDTNYDYKLLKDYFRITNLSPANVKNEAARLIYNLANLVDSRWGCGLLFGDDTCADLKVADAIFGPFIRVDYKETDPRRYYILEYFEANLSKIDKQKIISNLVMKNPIIVQGMNNYGPYRHVWLYTGVKVSGDSTIDELYINWGEGGSSNGWYAFNYNLGYVAYEVLFVKSINPDAEPGGGILG